MESMLVNEWLESKEEFDDIKPVFLDLCDDFETTSNEFSAQFGDGLEYFNFLPLFWPFIQNFPIESDDVLVATFAKCGTTWMQQIVHLLMTQDFDTKVPLTVRFPYLEFPEPMRQSVLIDLAKKKSPRLMKTHLPANLLPKKWANGKLIFVYRNAKDCAVSFYHHMKRYSNGLYQHDFKHFAKDFIQGKG